MSNGSTAVRDSEVEALQENLGGAILVIEHGGEEPVRAAVVDDAGVVTAVVLVPSDWKEQSPATRYQPPGSVVLLAEGEAPAVGATWNDDDGWVDPRPAPAPPRPLTADEQRRDVDALLRLVLRSQAGGTADDLGFVTVLNDMAQRGALDAETIDGALAWGVINSDERADLFDRLGGPQEVP